MIQIRLLWPFLVHKHVLWHELAIGSFKLLFEALDVIALFVVLVLQLFYQLLQVIDLSSLVHDLLL